MWNAAWDFITVNGAGKGRESQDNALSPTRQEMPGDARRCQEMPGDARKCQEMPGDARRCQVIERKGKKKKVTRGSMTILFTPRSAP
jgi:hypothetical protein